MGFGRPVVGGVLDKKLSSAASGRTQQRDNREPGANATSRRAALGQSGGLPSWDFQAKTPCLPRDDDVEGCRLLDVNLTANQFGRKRKRKTSV